MNLQMKIYLRHYPSAWRFTLLLNLSIVSSSLNYSCLSSNLQLISSHLKQQCPRSLSGKLDLETWHLFGLISPGLSHYQRSGLVEPQYGVLDAGDPRRWAGNRRDCRNEKTWALMLTLPSSSCVTLGDSQAISDTLLMLWWMGKNTTGCYQNPISL